MRPYLRKASSKNLRSLPGGVCAGEDNTIGNSKSLNNSGNARKPSGGIKQKR